MTAPCFYHQYLRVTEFPSNQNYVGNKLKLVYSVSAQTEKFIIARVSETAEKEEIRILKKISKQNK